jgi:hypothetical protein
LLEELEELEEYHGRAVFWSLRKMKEARDCQQQKDHNDQSLQHRKAEAIKLCDIARAEARLVRARGRRPTNLLINLPYM